MNMKKLQYPHPGRILREEFLGPLDLTPYRVAKDCGIPQPTMTQIVNGKRSINIENALRFSLYFGTTVEFWLNLQREYDVREVRRVVGRKIEAEVKPLPRAA